MAGIQALFVGFLHIRFRFGRQVFCYFDAGFRPEIQPSTEWTKTAFGFPSWDIRV